MNVQLNKSSLKKHNAFIALVLIGLAVLLIFFVMGLQNRLSDSESTRFAQLIGENNFREAKAISDKALAHSSVNAKTLSNMKQLVEKRAVTISQGLLDNQFILPDPNHYQNLTLFQDWLAPSLTAEMERVLGLYLTNSLSYQEITRYLNGMHTLGIFSEQVKEFAAKVTEEEEKRLVPYNGPISHVFFHPLIAYPELAFDGDAISRGYNEYFVTVLEFNKIIASLYQKGFVLIDINLIWEEVQTGNSKVLKQKELRLPPGKKPLIISIDDLNYYDYMKKNGNVYKLLLDEKGDVATYSLNPQGQEIISYDNEIIPLLDHFVQEHPDFSFHGAKGIIALTGYQGILGYRTDLLDSPDFNSEKDQALSVVKRLKETGWTFASHSYGHPNFSNIDLPRVVRDTAKWKAEVEPLIGPTNVFIFPYGTHVFPNDPKAKHLIDAGFNVHCYVGASDYLKFTPDAVIMDRWHIDGVAILLQGGRMKRFFDSQEVADSVRPPLVIAKPKPPKEQVILPNDEVKEGSI